jgi:hypothetical protein
MCACARTNELCDTATAESQSDVLQGSKSAAKHFVRNASWPLGHTFEVDLSPIRRWRRPLFMLHDATTACICVRYYAKFYTRAVANCPPLLFLFVCKWIYFAPVNFHKGFARVVFAKIDGLIKFATASDVYGSKAIIWLIKFYGPCGHLLPKALVEYHIIISRPLAHYCYCIAFSRLPTKGRNEFLIKKWNSFLSNYHLYNTIMGAKLNVLKLV